MTRHDNFTCNKCQWVHHGVTRVEIIEQWLLSNPGKRPTDEDKHEALGYYARCQRFK